MPSWRSSTSPQRPHSHTGRTAGGRAGGVGDDQPDVAAAMSIRPKTVEANLSRIYRKLGIKTRAELGRLIGDGR